MVTALFGVLLLISICVMIYIARKNYENMDVYYWTLVLLVPLIILGYWLKTRVTTPQAAAICFCFIYLDSTVLLVVILFSIARFMRIRILPWVKVISYSLAAAHLAMIWFCFDNGFYYKSITLVDTGMGMATKMTDGPLKFIHWIFLGAVLIGIIWLVVLAHVRKGTYSRRTLWMYTSVVLAGVILYVAETILDVNFTSLPILYVVGDIFIAMNYDHSHTHDIESLIANQRGIHANVGYAAVDLEGNFLSCNETMISYLPELATQVVDEKLKKDGACEELFYGLIQSLKEKHPKPQKIPSGAKTLQCSVTEFSMLRNGKAQGYLFEMRDVTEEERDLQIKDNYNETLNKEVKEKTENIRQIQQKIVLGLANMVENRDSNTGGHVKRTSDVIRFIVREVQNSGAYEIDDQFATDVIRAAPMHDLGKITIENNILNKKGRLDAEEYKIMKTHSAKSGEFVKIILDGVEEQHFVDVAFNVARYHHERWDGGGYPDGLVGDLIPLEARMMAIADVYDALVSKRVYKPAMSFEQAAEIMLEGMGTQFDPNMKAVFLGCRKDMENYYRKMKEESVGQV